MIEVADIFRAHSSEYIKQYNPPFDVLKVINAIESCRTEKLGGHKEKCDECGHIRISYNSCRNRHCPKCQGLVSEEWVADRMDDLLPIPYFHVIFTIPAELNPLVLHNKKLLYNILFKAVSKTLLTLAKDKLGAKIGFIAILHTWGQNLMEHPHIHCLVTGGGLSLDETKWCPTGEKYFLSVEALSETFKGKFQYYLKGTYFKGRLRFPNSLKHLIPRNKFLRFCNKIENKDWVVHSKAPFNSAENVLLYLGRYTQRVAIANKRILEFKDGKVTFQWKDYADDEKIKLMTLEALEFMRRFLLHVLPCGFIKIRHYGILSNRNKKDKLQKCVVLLGIARKIAEKIATNETWQERLLRLTGFDITRCPVCKKGTMIPLGGVSNKATQRVA